MAMTELAQHQVIKVIISSLLPISYYPFLKQQSGSAPQQGGRGPRMRMTDAHPPADILKLNAWLKDYASRVNAVYADYFAAIVDEKGWLRDEISADGLHPNADGYKVMAPIAASAIQRALQK